MAALLAACAASSPPGPSSSPSRDITLLPSGSNLFVFDFVQGRYQKWPLVENRGQADVPADSLCRIADTLEGDWAAASHWLALAPPAQPFLPFRAAWGPNGNFYVMDRVGRRVAQYDTAGRFLSSLSMPREIRDGNLERFQLFWTRDGVFSFVDRTEEKVWQYVEAQALGGNRDWQLRNVIQLPVGMGECVWEPFLRNPCCLRRSAGGAPGAVCFDSYFSSRGPWDGTRQAGRIQVEPAASSWQVSLHPDSACGPPITFPLEP